MRHWFIVSLCIGGTLALSACGANDQSSVDRKLQEVNVIDETNLSDVMLTVADPGEAVNYFRRSGLENPDRIDLQRGLAASLVRAKRPHEAVIEWRKVAAMEGATNDDKVGLADAQIRANEFDAARETLNSIPPTYETFKRYRLEAIVADAAKDWKKADAFYETALGLTLSPAGVLNNWGYSKLTRGDFAGAERLLTDSIRQDNSVFTAKNNLVLARGAQGNYTLPVIPMDQTERAKLLHTLALTAIKQGDVKTGQALLKEAIETHPQHFEEATRSLRALEGTNG
ncbi:tetratricopeptide repeat protein [Donghicola eburneus]|uniref:Putative pilus assembly protein, ATPase CpaF n=1 Tax=Donghicola eburneus TaxID=393278 RepID=A0A1M4MZ74_9RHOB|nr:tetratricopeptide repeat protein [Donghicola eburneus]SCM67088.1 putative pilus assembly protein, ATPase CpaF [Donghicola eburneus]SFQ72127.1 Flp pilus assembly protein TadD, contains TPR repeats [Donghicola eburneus]